MNELEEPGGLRAILRLLPGLLAAAGAAAVIGIASLYALPFWGTMLVILLVAPLLSLTNGDRD